MNVKKGDVVAVRGDLRINNNGQCAYTDNQLWGGKYIRHAGHNGIWTGVVSYISGDRAIINGSAIFADRCEVIYRNYSRP
jgi:hypothetical protein